MATIRGYKLLCGGARQRNGNERERKRERERERERGDETRRVEPKLQNRAFLFAHIWHEVGARRRASSGNNDSSSDK